MASKQPFQDHAYRPNKYKEYFKELNYKDIEMPMAVTDIDKFEKMNDLIINVYGCNEDGSEIYPRRISKKRGKAINLLMLENGEAYHYVLIKNLNGLLRSHADGNHTKEFCPYCCWGFDKRYLKPGQMAKHMDDCFKYKGTKVIMPKKDKNTIKFTNYSQQLKAPYTIYADFESVLKKDSERETIHEICGYSLCVKSPYEEDEMYDFRGENAGRQFIGHIQSLGKELKQKIGKANA